MDEDDNDISAEASGKKMQLTEFGATGPLTDTIDPNDKSAADLAPVFDVPVNISAVLGRANLSVAQLLQLGQGSVLELDRKVGEAIDIYVNNRTGGSAATVIVVDDRLLAVTMTEIMQDNGSVAA